MPTTHPLITEAQAALNRAAQLVDELSTRAAQPAPYDPELFEAVGQLHATVRVLDGFISEVWHSVAAKALKEAVGS